MEDFSQTRETWEVGERGIFRDNSGLTQLPTWMPWQVGESQVTLRLQGDCDGQEDASLHDQAPTKLGGRNLCSLTCLDPSPVSHHNPTTREDLIDDPFSRCAAVK